MNPPYTAKKILIIDDDLTTIKLVESRLSANGYLVIALSEAALGLEAAFKQKPDLIVLDVMMPIVNGFNFCRLLKSQEEHRHIPVILLTSRSEDKDRKIGQEVGANAYLTKPVNADELLNTIKELLMNSRS
ncbi:MAG: hypothetical protein A2Z88_06410 [Omnitrophica WOR_2 bacterium GWA2_47_8]|nr:MAG: hypothetical protein A2Z88_06410 [Omnitrophica WOR_2 bacterium GWA2_47_8]